MGTFVDKEIVYVEAWHSTSVTFSWSAYKTIPFQTKIQDSRDAFNGTVFTCPAEGVYHVSSVFVTANVAWSPTNHIHMAWNQNGNPVRIREYDSLLAVSQGWADLSFSTYLATGTTCSMRALIVRSGEGGITPSQPGVFNNLQIVRILPPYRMYPGDRTYP